MNTLILSSVLALAAPQDDPASQAMVTLIDQRLQRVSARISAVSPRQLVADIQGVGERASPAERWIGWTAPVEPAEGAPSLVLVDGQRFYGMPAGGSGDVLRWAADGAGPIEATLEQIDRVVLAPGFDPGPSVGAIDDVVVLTNGDRLEGFVGALGSGVEIEVEGRSMQLPLQRIAVIDLASPAAERSGAYMWFADGSVARLEARGDTYLLAQAPSGWEASAPLLAARAFVFDAARIRALGELEMTGHEPIDRRWAPPPGVEGDVAGLWAASVSLPGPMRVTWALPRGATRFGAVIELREDSRVWGDCEVIVSQRRAGDPGAGAELARVRLTGARPQAQIAVDLDGSLGAGELVVAVQPGASGPVQDRVRIDGAVLLIGP